MKKYILFTGLLLCIVCVAVAQDEDRLKGAIAKNGQNILPAAGDFAIGIEANPFLEYLGNLFTSAQNNAPLFNGKDLVLRGKYFTTDYSAFRFGVKLNYAKESYKGTVRNDYEWVNNPTNVLATTVDVKSDASSNFELALGYELRRGYGRLQGFGGLDLRLGYGNASSSFEYGNEMTPLNQSPSSIDFLGSGSEQALNLRPISHENGSTTKFGIGAFVGVEYFIAPKISVGGELGLQGYFFNQTQGKIEYEHVDQASANIQVVKRRYRDPNVQAASGAFQTVASGNIYLMFHF